MVIKICGLTRTEDALLAEELGADYLGFIFAPTSLRFIRPARFKSIRSALGSRAAVVGVFVDCPIETVRSLFRECRLDVVQLHGHEPPEYLQALALPCWKAVRPGRGIPGESPAAYEGRVLVLDPRDPDRPNDGGRPFDLVLVEQAIRTGAKVIVAGGVSEENIVRAAPLRPFGFDVSSSIEISPGRKSEEKMRRLFAVWKNLVGRHP